MAVSRRGENSLGLPSGPLGEAPASPTAMLRFAKFSLEGASLKALAAGGASLAGVLAGGGLWYRQELLKHHPISAFAAAQLCASKDVQQLFESETVSTTGFIGGYVDMNSRTAVLTLPVHSANGKGVARVEAEATVVRADEARTSLDFIFGPDPLRWTLRHLEVVKDSPVATPARVLYSLPAHHPLPAWAPGRELSALRSLLSREAQALLPADNSLVGFVSFHVLGLAVIVGWLRLRVRTERAHKALEALILLPPEPWLLRLRLSALEAETARAPPTTSMLNAPPKITCTNDDFYGGPLVGGSFGKEVAAYTRVSSHMGEVDLLMHARRRGRGSVEWELVNACTADPRDTEAVLAGANDDPEAARSAIFQMVTTAHATAAGAAPPHERTGRKPR